MEGNYGYNFTLYYGDENMTMTYNTTGGNGTDFWDGYDWGIIEEFTEEELDEETKEQLSDIAREVEGFLTENVATRFALGAAAAATIFALAQ